MPPAKAVAAVIAAAVAAYAVLSRVGKRLLSRPVRIGDAVIQELHDDTTSDPRTGAVRSIQSADITMPEEDLEAIWSPMHLERLARTYWRFLSRATLGLVHVEYTDAERFVVFLRKPFVLLRFQAPEYEMDGARGVVRWRIERGVLVSRRGRGGDGYLEIDVQRRRCDEPGRARIHVEVEVANFYPAIASRFGQWLYAATQSRIHVLVTYGFLRNVAKLDLEESVVGRFATQDELPDPRQPLPRDRDGVLLRT
jgi:hypothetical protein